MIWLRSAAAVFAGFAGMTLAAILVGAAASAVLADGADPRRPAAGYLAAVLGGSLVAAVAGGALAASLAPRRPVAHAVALAGVVLGIGLASVTLADPAAAGQPGWYPPVAVAVGVVGVLLGGFLRRGREPGTGAGGGTPESAAGGTGTAAGQPR